MLPPHSTVSLIVVPYTSNDGDARDACYRFDLVNAHVALPTGATVLYTCGFASASEEARVCATFATRADVLCKAVTRYRDAGCWRDAFDVAPNADAGARTLNKIDAAIAQLCEYAREGYSVALTMRDLRAISTARLACAAISDANAVVVALTTRLQRLWCEFYIEKRRFRETRLPELLRTLATRKSDDAIAERALSNLLRRRGIARIDAEDWILRRVLF